MSAHIEHTDASHTVARLTHTRDYTRGAGPDATKPALYVGDGDTGLAVAGALTELRVLARSITAAVDTAPVRRMLDLSNRHLPEHIGVGALDELDGVTAYPLPHGWLMWVPTDVDDWSAEYEPASEVLAIARYARAHDCDYVLIDADGPTVADLPKWEW